MNTQVIAPDRPLESRRLVLGGVPLRTRATTQRIYAGIAIGGERFENVEDLATARRQIAYAVNAHIGIDMRLAGRIAVVKNTMGAKNCFLFIDPESTTEDEVCSVLSELKTKGWSLPVDGPQGFFASYTVVTSLAHGHLDSIQGVTATGNQESSLFDAFREFVAWGCAQGADDIDWIVRSKDASSQIAFKIEGRWHHPERFKIPTPTMISILGAAWQKTEGGKAATFDTVTVMQGNVEVSLPQGDDFPDGGRVRLRWSALPNEKGTVVTTRIQRLGQSARITSLEGAGYSQWQIDAMRRATKSKGGLVTLAGRVGSGKTTTLAILLSELSRSQKIQTAEDPVEIDIPGAFQRTIARDLSQSTEDEDTAFNATVMGVLRSALDVFYQSEIRDAKSGRLARQVLESGHGVYTTTHARSGLGIVNRFTSPEIGIPKEVLGLPDGLKTNIFQAMISVSCPVCSKSPDDYASAFNLQGNVLSEHKKYFDLIEELYGICSTKFRLRDERGCEHCRREQLPSLNGLAGRTPVCEIIEFDADMLELVYKGDDYGLIHAWRSKSNGKYNHDDLTGKTAMECAILKASMGIIDPREIEPEFTTFETIKQQRRKLK